MARIKLEIPKDELQRTINQVESSHPNGQFENRSLLHDAVADTDWAKNFDPKPVTASVVCLRIAELNIDCKTPKGKRGRSGGFSGPPRDVKRITRRQKYKLNPQLEDHFNKLEEYIKSQGCGETWLRTLQKVRKGSVKAMIRLNCAACMGFENVAVNVRGCTAAGVCPMWAERPYQNLTVNGDDVDLDALQDKIDAEDLAEASVG